MSVFAWFMLVSGAFIFGPTIWKLWLGFIWWPIKFRFLHFMVAYIPEEYCPRWLLLWHAREDFIICRFLGESIESRYLIARDNARYL